MVFIHIRLGAAILLSSLLIHWRQKEKYIFFALAYNSNAHRLLFQKHQAAVYTNEGARRLLYYSQQFGLKGTHDFIYERGRSWPAQYRTQNTFTQAKGQINVWSFFSLSLKSWTWSALAKTRSSFCVHGRAAPCACTTIRGILKNLLSTRMSQMKLHPDSTRIHPSFLYQQHIARRRRQTSHAPPDRRFKVLRALEIVEKRPASLFFLLCVFFS